MCQGVTGQLAVWSMGEPEHHHLPHFYTAAITFTTDNTAAVNKIGLSKLYCVGLNITFNDAQFRFRGGGVCIL